MTGFLKNKHPRILQVDALLPIRGVVSRTILDQLQQPSESFDLLEASVCAVALPDGGCEVMLQDERLEVELPGYFREGDVLQVRLAGEVSQPKLYIAGAQLGAATFKHDRRGASLVVLLCQAAVLYLQFCVATLFAPLFFIGKLFRQGGRNRRDASLPAFPVHDPELTLQILHNSVLSMSRALPEECHEQMPDLLLFSNEIKEQLELFSRSIPEQSAVVDELGPMVSRLDMHLSNAALLFVSGSEHRGSQCTQPHIRLLQILRAQLTAVVNEPELYLSE